MTESHRCPRRFPTVALEIVVAAIVGAFVGLLLVTLADPHGKFEQVDGIAMIVGAIAGVIADRVLRT